MRSLPARRFRRLHEQVLLSRPFSLIVGWIFSVAAPSIVYWGPSAFQNPDQGQKTALVATSIAFLLAYIGAKNLLSRFPGGRSQGMITTQVIMFYAIVILGTLMLRIPVSRMLLVSSGAAAMVWFQIDYLFTRAYFFPKLAIIPGGFANKLPPLKQCDARPLAILDLQGIRYDGVIADFSTVTPAEERFLTACALKGVPVYDAKTAYESLTGRVRIDQMSENNIGSLLPSPAYRAVKGLLDRIIVLVCLPFVLPLAGITAVLIRLESPGPVIYSQTRIGLGNRPFILYKFRSMRYDPKHPAQFARDGDPRVTRVGRVIRKLRIDELPQFYNVLKGDMSLIGPRPEQPRFVEDFSTRLPFYSYRHVVKPGITGWAQIRYGYAADANETQVKIEHDFYYIKNCSFSLDFLIILVTLKTILSGFGAR